MSFLDDLEQKAEKIATLEIKTIVGEAIFADDDSGDYTLSDGAKTMYTSIDLLQGDITSIIPEAFMSAPYATMRQYHQAREDAGRQIIKDNINCLKELVTLVKSLAESKSTT